MNNTRLSLKDSRTLFNLIAALNNSYCKPVDDADVDDESKPTDMDAFFYIVVVLAFYASSIVLLLIKYSRKDDEEKFLNHQFSEFVKRDRFQSSTYQNRIALLRTQEILASLDDNKGLPKIMIQKCGDLEERRPTIGSVNIDVPIPEENSSQSSVLNISMVTVNEVEAAPYEEFLEIKDLNNGDSGINEGSEEEIMTLQDKTEADSSRIPETTLKNVF